MPIPTAITLRVGSFTGSASSIAQPSLFVARRRQSSPPFLALLVAWCVTTQARAADLPATSTSAFLHFDSLAAFAQLPPGPDSDRTRLSPWIASPVPWTELIASWNVRSNVALRVEVRARVGDHVTRFYHLGSWAIATNDTPTPTLRSSVRDQSDADGEVQTDTLVLKAPSSQFQLRLTFTHGRPGPEDFRFFGVALSGPRLPAPDPPRPAPTTYGAPLDVPIRSQADFPEGISQWCSPTSLTMVLAHHARTLGRPELDFPVPDVARAVFDPGWPGTGNWSFNVAFAGAQPGLRAYVARLPNLVAMEPWISRNVPVIASVSYALLKGRPQPERGDGHLVVITGFNEAGEVVINDPGVRRERVRRTFPRADFERAWAHSRNTVYLVHPDTLPALGVPAPATP